MDQSASDNESVARATQNELIFRRANEKIERERENLGVDGKIPFLCECGEKGCQELVRIAATGYAEARVTARHFLLAKGHAFKLGRVVAEHDGYMVVEKTGEAGAIAERGLGDG